MENCSLLSNSVICTDKRIKTPPASCVKIDKHTYECPLAHAYGYQCTNPVDLNAHMKWDEDMIGKLKSCQKGL